MTMNKLVTKLLAGLSAVSLASIASGCHVPGHGRPEVVKLKPAPLVAKVARPPATLGSKPSRPSRPSPY